MVAVFLTILAAVSLDAIFSEPRRFHPLVGLGRWISFVERRLNPDSGKNTDFTPYSARHIRASGLLGVLLCCLPGFILCLLIFFLASFSTVLHDLLAVVVLYLCIGMKSLLQHAKAVIVPLSQVDQPQSLDSARYAVSMIVSRDTESLDTNAIAKATIESVLENGADAVFSAIFWFVIAGIPGVIFYRTMNTLDAMWGYKNARFLHFGFFAARIDDALNYMPARLTAFSYALCGHYRQALHCWRLQAKTWKSPNAGPVMASGAGALGVILGGAACYHGQIEVRPILGMGCEAGVSILQKSCHLVIKALLLWLFVLGAISLLFI